MKIKFIQNLIDRLNGKKKFNALNKRIDELERLLTECLLLTKNAHNENTELKQLMEDAHNKNIELKQLMEDTRNKSALFYKHNQIASIAIKEHTIVFPKYKNCHNISNGARFREAHPNY